MNAIPDPIPPAFGPTGTDTPSGDAVGAATGAHPSGPAGTALPDAAPTPPPLAKWLLVYTLLRLGTLVVLTVLLSLLMPLILALLFAVVLALPLSWVVFGNVRRRVNEAMAASASVRRSERERLRAALDGRNPE